MDEVNLTFEKGSLPDWLLDAPLFVDDALIRSLYYAVALPEYEQESLTIAAEDIKTKTWSVGGKAETEASFGGIASFLASLKASVGIEASRGGTAEEKNASTIELVPVDSSERRLLNLAVHYSANLEERTWNVFGLKDFSWITDAARVASQGKPLIFLDVPHGVPIVPMAAELPDGNVILFYNRISSAVKGPSEQLPAEYPRKLDPDGMNAYWDWFQSKKPGKDADTSYILMHVVEEAIGTGGRPRWIDFRVPLGDVGSQNDSLHLHFKAREKYDTGDFAYHFVHRGRKHGFRLVGMLKEGPALNVLALYEK
ncbi:hypothetical protein ACIGKQ_23510 [Gordonia sp. NPDC062954]|uniref:hypothetical protein n=1 Tax=Gordonia sp. NPDC062954 TaxID=3364003 RepID=UPI0037CAB5DF